MVVVCHYEAAYSGWGPTFPEPTPLCRGSSSAIPVPDSMTDLVWVTTEKVVVPPAPAVQPSSLAGGLRTGVAPASPTREGRRSARP